MRMGEQAGSRRRGAIGLAVGSALAGLLAAIGGGSLAQAADRTFNVSLVGSLNPLTTGPGTTNNIYADLWSEGNIVALGSVSTASSGGVTLINNANPAAPTKIGQYLPAGINNGQFRDVIIRNGIGYFAIDGGLTVNGGGTVGGTHIVNLANLAAAPLAVIKDPLGFVKNHDLFLDGNNLYIANNDTNVMKVWNVANPASPTLIRSITTAGVATDDLHDMTIKNGRMYTSNLSNGITQIYDVSNMSATVAPTFLGQLDVGTRNHSSWPSEDGNLLAVAREDVNGEVQLWNIANPAAPSLISSITAAGYGMDTHSAHNPVIVGDTLYVSWYQAGLQIFSIRNPATPVHLGAYDTFVGGDGNAGSFSGYDGNWGLDVSGGPSRILLSDFDNGFFTVNATDAFRQVWTYAGGPIHWQDNSRWDNGAGPFPNSSEMTASFTNPAAGASRTVFVDSFYSPTIPRVAAMEFVNTLNYTIQGVGSGAVEMVSSDGPAKITVLNGGAGATGVNHVTAPITLNDDLLVTNNANVAAGASLELGTINASNRTITFAGGGETAMIAANPGFTGNVVVISGKLTLRQGQAINAQPISAASGVLVLRNNSSTDFGSDLTVTGATSLALGNGGAGSGQTHALDDITVNAGGALTLFRNNSTRLAAGDVTITGAMHVSQQAGGGANATRFDTLNILPGGRLDLADTSLIVASTPVGTVESFVRSAYNFNAWDGSGIATAQPDALAGLTTLAVVTAQSAFRESFGGFSVSGDDVLVMYTYAGDVNLDGLVDAADYGTIDNYYQFPGTSGYANGDFNFDGIIDAGDYGLIDNAYQLQGAPLVVSDVIAGAAGVTAVPEPGAVSAMVAALAAVGSMTRRRRRR